MTPKEQQAFSQMRDALAEIVKFWDSVVPEDCINLHHINARAALAAAEDAQTTPQEKTS